MHDDVKDTKRDSNKIFKMLTLISQLAIQLSKCNLVCYSLLTNKYNFENLDYCLDLDQELFMR